MNRQAYDKAKEGWSVDSEREQLEKMKRIESQIGKFVLQSQEQVSQIQAQINDLKFKYNALFEAVRIMELKEKAEVGLITKSDFVKAILDKVESVEADRVKKGGSKT